MVSPAALFIVATTRPEGEPAKKPSRQPQPTRQQRSKKVGSLRARLAVTSIGGLLLALAATAVLG